MIAILLVISAWCAFPFTAKTWSERNLAIPRMAKRKPNFDVLPFVLSFQLEMEAGATSRKAITQSLSQVHGDHLPATRAANTSELPAAQALLQDSRTHPELKAMALAVAISEISGARMGNALRNLTSDVLVAKAERGEIQAELASTKATIAVLAALPIAGMFLGSVLGASPLTWLISSTFGRACLLLAVVLEGIGLFWIRRLIRGAIA